MNNYDVIIFDLDGTLSNSKEGITKSVQYALSKFGIEEPDLDKLEHFIGPPLVDELMKSYDFTREQALEGVEFYRERYKPIGIYETEIYPGTEEMLEMLKGNGKYIALATSKPLPMAEEVLKYLKIYSYFDKVTVWVHTIYAVAVEGEGRAGLHCRAKHQPHDVLDGDAALFDVNR